MVRGIVKVTTLALIAAGISAGISDGLGHSARADVLSPGVVSSSASSSLDAARRYFPTGNAELDLPDPNLPGAKNNPRYNPGIVVVQDNNGNPNDVAVSGPVKADGLITGWNFKDFRFQYDPKTDIMAVGVNFFTIAGDADSNGLPGVSDPRTLAAGGVDLPNLGGRESIAVAFDTNLDGTLDLVAGVPQDKTAVSPDRINGFNVVKPLTNPDGSLQNMGIERLFGSQSPQHMGALAFDPSADHPDFTFTIENFSKLPGLSTDKDFEFQFRAYAGTLDDVVAGEDLFQTSVPITVPRTQVPIPEPMSVLAWTLLAGGAIGLRRRVSRGSTC